VEKIVEEGRQRAMDVGVLTAGRAIGPKQLGAAIQAVGFVRVPALAGFGLDGAAHHCTRYRVSDRIQIRHPIPPWLHIRRRLDAMLAAGR